MKIVNWQSNIKKNVLVVGLGESGRAAAQWLVKQGSNVTVSEKRKKADCDKDVVADLLRSGVKLEFGGHRIKSFLVSDLIIVSPGISLDITPLSQARDQGIPIIGEIELASRYLKTPCIAVTGTNGKSTVVNLIGEMLRKGGKRVFVGGNIGLPLTQYIAGEQEVDYVVLEVSSFQLDTTQTFSPLMALILNVSPDHLDRYADYTAYVRSKERVFANQGPEQILILNDDDPWLRKEQPKNGPTVYRYGLESRPERIAALKNGGIAAGGISRIKHGIIAAIKFFLLWFPGNENCSKRNLIISSPGSLAAIPPFSKAATRSGLLSNPYLYTIGPFLGCSFVSQGSSSFNIRICSGPWFANTLSLDLT